MRLDRRSLEIKAEFSELVRPEDYPVTPLHHRPDGHHPRDGGRPRDLPPGGPALPGLVRPPQQGHPAAWGAYYDVPLLRKECQRFELPFREHIVGGAFDIRALGVAWLATQDVRTSGATLESVVAKMGLDGRFTSHRAVEDARATAAVLQVHHLGRAVLD